MRKRTYPVERTFNPIIQIKKQNIMATLTVEQIEQKKQQLKQLAAEAQQLKNELVEAGAWSLEENDLDNVTGGVQAGSILKGGEGEFGPKKPTERVKPKYKPYL